jgi:hypothetical protein
VLWAVPIDFETPTLSFMGIVFSSSGKQKGDWPLPAPSTNGVSDSLGISRARLQAFPDCFHRGTCPKIRRALAGAD